MQKGFEEGFFTPLNGTIPLIGRIERLSRSVRCYSYKESSAWSLTLSVGNGCSATQFVPVISQGENQVKRVTQFSRQAHWLAERRNLEYSSLFRWSMRWIPASMRLYRAKLYWDKEVTFRGFKIQSGEGIREAWTKEATDYIRNNAPKMYREALVPKTVIGCKRLVNDTDYLACLHRENVELVYDDPIKEILEDGVRTRSGRQVKADAIVLATGFETQRFLSPIDIRGEKGIGLQEHVSCSSLTLSKKQFQIIR